MENSRVYRQSKMKVLEREKAYFLDSMMLVALDSLPYSYPASLLLLYFADAPFFVEEAWLDAATKVEITYFILVQCT